MDVDRLLGKFDADRKAEKWLEDNDRRLVLRKMLPIGWAPLIGRLILLDSTAVETSERGDMVYRMHPLEVHGFCKIPMAVGDLKEGPVVFVQSKRPLGIAQISHVHRKGQRVHYVAVPVVKQDEARAFLLKTASEMTAAMELSRELGHFEALVFGALAARDMLLLLANSP